MSHNQYPDNSLAQQVADMTINKNRQESSSNPYEYNCRDPQSQQAYQSQYHPTQGPVSPYTKTESQPGRQYYDHSGLPGSHQNVSHYQQDNITSGYPSYRQTQDRNTYQQQTSPSQTYQQGPLGYPPTNTATGHPGYQSQNYASAPQNSLPQSNSPTQQSNYPPPHPIDQQNQAYQHPIPKHGLAASYYNDTSTTSPASNTNYQSPTQQGPSSPTNQSPYPYSQYASLAAKYNNPAPAPGNAPANSSSDKSNLVLGALGGAFATHELGKVAHEREHDRRSSRYDDDDDDDSDTRYSRLHEGGSGGAAVATTAAGGAVLGSRGAEDMRRRRREDERESSSSDSEDEEDQRRAWRGGREQEDIVDSDDDDDDDDNDSDDSDDSD